MNTQPYQICLHLGPKPELPATTFVDITPAEDSIAAMLNAISASGLTAADLRTRTLFHADATRPLASVMMYSALIGFAGRRLDFTTAGNDVVVASSLHQAAAQFEAPDAEGDPAPWIQAGATHAAVPSVAFGTELEEHDVALLRSSRRCRIAIDDITTYDLLTLFVTVAAFRVRNGADRLPYIVTGAQDPLEVLDADGESITNGVDVDALRRAGGELRRSRRLDDRNAVVDALARTPRMEKLARAAGLPVELALTLVGSRMQADTELWHCPRPQRHRNGDANASMKVADGMIRCFRCDPEPMDALRLVAEVKNLSPDDAADLLLAQTPTP